ncbi:MAG: type II secretion system F family protein [Armatimonadetes bacterium]|nr:type II secretion system F family protein [Armatimonadota bacterium]
MVYMMALCWLGFVAMVFMLVTSAAGGRVMRHRLQALSEVTEAEVAAAQIDEEEAKPFIERALSPILKKLGGVIGQNEKLVGGNLAELLDSAGHPLGMMVNELIGLKLLFVILLGVVSVFLWPVIHIGVGKLASNPSFATAVKLKPLIPLILLVFCMVGFSLPDFLLRRTAKKRIKQIKKSMPDVVDLVTLGLEAGLGFDGAVGQTIDKVKSPLTEELARSMREIAAGKTRSDAFRSMATRVKMPELSLLVTAIDQAEKMGVGLGTALRAQADELRERRRMWAQEQAAKLPVKMLIPLILFIFPALFIVILGPACVQFAEMAKSGQMF